MQIILLAMHTVHALGVVHKPRALTIYHIYALPEGDENKAVAQP